MTTNPCEDVQPCGNCRRGTAVAFVTAGCVHEHVIIYKAACEVCLGRLQHGDSYCVICLRKGCEECPMQLIRVEKMIFGHEGARDMIQNFRESRTDASWSRPVLPPMTGP